MLDLRAAICCAIFLFSLIANVAVQASHYPLHVERGVKPAIKDSLGRTVLIRGVNLNALGDYYQANPNQTTTIPASEKDFEEMAALGFNVVRLVLSWSLLEPEPGKIDEAYIAKIKTFVGYAKKHGLYTVLDMHQDAWGKYIASNGSEECGFFEPSIGWDGAPEWATLTEGQSTCRLPGVREISPAVATAFENFWRNKNGIQDHLINVWARLATEFADEPAIAGYDLMNEPNFGLSVVWTQTFQLGNFYTRATQAIRKAENSVANGFNHIVFFEPTAEWSAFSITLWPIGFFIFDNNIVFSPHLYGGSISIVGNIEEGYRNAKQVADFYRAPFWSGEWGWFGSGEAVEQEVWQYVQLEDHYQIGGATWQWKQACGDPHPQKYWDGQEVIETQNQVNIIHCPDSSEGGVNPVYARVLTRAYPKHTPGDLHHLYSNPFSGYITVSGTTNTKGNMSLWVPSSDRVATPQISGTNSPATITQKYGGYWIEAPVTGDYTIEIDY